MFHCMGKSDSAQGILALTVDKLSSKYLLYLTNRQNFKRQKRQADFNIDIQILKMLSTKFLANDK
jgi:hypothetical protein